MGKGAWRYKKRAWRSAILKGPRGNTIVDADDFLFAFETNCTEFRHALFPRERDLYIHESNGNVRTYENQA